MIEEKVEAEAPLPDHAMKVWFDGSNICLQLPPNNHTVRIPIERCGIVCSSGGTPLPSQRGFVALLDILKERYHSTQRSHRVIGRKASPIQYDLDKVLLAVKPKRAQKPSLEEITLADLLSEIEL